jgi:hypothetical protein
LAPSPTEGRHLPHFLVGLEFVEQTKKFVKETKKFVKEKEKFVKQTFLRSVWERVKMSEF